MWAALPKNEFVDGWTSKTARRVRVTDLNDDMPRGDRALRAYADRVAFLRARFRFARTDSDVGRRKRRYEKNQKSER